MKAHVKYFCGHEADVDLVGSAAVLQQKLDGLKKSLCAACLAEAWNACVAGCLPREMSIDQWEREYPDCRRMKVDAEKGTVIAWVPENRA